MPISVETETIVVKTTYTCDVLFKEFPKEELHSLVTASDLCLSKEAFNLLPEDIQKDDQLIECVVRGCGYPKDGFHPNDLKCGYWIIQWGTGESWLTNVKKYRYGCPHFVVAGNKVRYPNEPTLCSLEDCMENISGKIHKGNKFWILHNGEIIKKIEVEVIKRLKEVGNNVVITTEVEE